MSAELHRSESAIKKRIVDLKLKNRPIRHEERVWSDEETETLLKMFKEGHSWEAIRKAVGRSGLAAHRRYEAILNPKYVTHYDRRRRDIAKGCSAMIDQCVHFRKVKGCDLEILSCAGCYKFLQRDPDQPAESGWVSASRRKQRKEKQDGSNIQ